MMYLVDETLILSQKENEIFRKLCEGKTQAEVANEILKSSPYVNQITKKLLTYEAIICISKSQYNRIYAEKDPSKKIKIYNKPLGKAKKCKFCHKPFYSKNRKRKYCSKYCFARAASGPNNPNWNGGKKFEPYCWKFNEDLKENVREFFGRKCFSCGDPENEKSLAVHHLKYNKMACCDGGGDPLFIPLCETCHNTTSKIKNRYFIERLFYNQLIIRTGGKCMFEKLVWMDMRIKKEKDNNSQTISL